jgi:hypothetical protein
VNDDERVIPYRHDVTALTLGDLARAIGVPDDVELAHPRDTKVVVSTLREPSTAPGTDRMEADRYVVTYAELEPDWVPPSWVDGVRVEGFFQEPGTTLVIGTDFEAGGYEKREPNW